MYAVIRAGGKQYRVAPGDVIRVEKMSGANGNVEFSDVLAVSGSEGEVRGPQGGARVTAEVLGETKGEKVLVFHYKKKKQYKKLQGHRQQYTAVRITEIAFDGQSFKAPERPKAEPKPKPQPEHETAEAAPAAQAKGKAKPAKKSAAKKTAAHKPEHKAPAKKGTTKKK
jgi:large subunit ribosomal protein L21